MKKKLEIPNLICYGYGAAFQIIEQLLDLDIKYVIDRDISKWGETSKGYEVIGWEYLQMLDLTEFNFLILPFNSEEIKETLIDAGVERTRLYFLKDILNGDIELSHEFNYLQTNFYSNNYKKHFRTLRLQQVGIIDQAEFENLYKKWLYDIPYFEYRGINLKQLLSSDITILLDYVYNPEIDIDLYAHPLEESYRIYGNGPILAPIFPRNRPDFCKRLHIITKDIIDEMQFLTYSDNNLGFVSKTKYKEFHFKYEYKEHYEMISNEIIRHINNTYFKLSNYEYKWLDYSIKFYLCLIDFYLDILKLDFKIKLLLLPHYGEENIITQYKKVETQSIVYQHGDILDAKTNKNYKDFAQNLYRYNFEVDYYLTWDEASKESLQSIILDGQSKDIRIFGNTLELNYSSNEKKRHFIVCFPGKIKQDEAIITKLLDIAGYIADKMDLTFDIRYHPLNRKGIKIDTLKYKKEVSIENFDINEYDFSISCLTSLIKEFYLAGLPSFEMGDLQTFSNGCFTREDDLEKLISDLYKSLSKKIYLNKNHSKPEQNYKNFFKELLER